MPNIEPEFDTDWPQGPALNPEDFIPDPATAEAWCATERVLARVDVGAHQHGLAGKDPYFAEGRPKHDLQTYLEKIVHHAQAKLADAYRGIPWYRSEDHLAAIRFNASAAMLLEMRPALREGNDNAAP